MSSVDERIVEMKFNNAQFESGVKQTQASLDGLKKNLDLSESAKSLQNLNDTGRRFSLEGIQNGVENISSKFTAIGIVGVTALANIANSAINTGKQLISSLTIDPIKTGLDEYNTNLNSIQTILANTQASGATLKDVNGALQELNLYSDKTIYNFSEMARNIGTFTAAGVDLKTATGSIKGIANLAALSGSNSQQASTAMYQLSQAISAGKVGLQDWNSVVNAGMGGTVFQRALAQTANQMGTLKDSAVKLVGPMKNVKINGKSFRESITAKPGETSWLTSDVLTKTLQHFTGDMTDAQLAAEGFSKSQIKSIQLQAQTASQAATVVKTLPQLIGTLQESAQSGWSQSFQYIFGDFEQAKELFTGVNNVIGGMISSSANARNKVLKTWEENGGRATAITAVAQAFKAVMNVITPIQKAFRQIFPPTTANQLLTITTAVSKFAQTLQNATKAVGPQIQRTFAGLFAVLDIGRMILFEVVKTLFSLFGTVGSGAGSFLDVTAAIGDFLVNLRNAIRDGNGLSAFFDGLRKVLQVPLALIGAIGGAIASLFESADNSGATSRFNNAIGTMESALTPFGVAVALIQKAWGRFASTVGSVFQMFAPLASALGEAFQNLGSAIADSVKTGDFGTVLDTINTGLLGGIVLLLKNFMKGGIKFDFTVFGGVKEALGGITGVLQGMQQNLKANVLLKIAGALGILTLSVFVLSTIDSAALTKALIAITAMFTQLGAALVVFEKISSGPGIIKLPLVAGSLILIAGAIVVLAGAVKMLSGLSWEELTKGLIGVGVLLGALAGYTQLMAKNTPKMIATGLGLLAIAVAINILATAVGKLGGMDTGAMIQGLAGVATALAIIAGFSRIMNPTAMVSTGVGLVLLGASLQLFARAIAAMGNLDIATIGKGLLAMAGALGIIAGAMQIMPKGMILQAVALVAVGAALNLIADALGKMGGLSMDQIGKSLGVMAASLIILAGSLILMTEALPGAAALLVAAIALNVLAPALVTLGSMDIETIGKALGVLAASLIIIAGSLILMTAALPGAAALLVASAALFVLSGVLTTLGSMDIGQILIAIGGLALALAVLGVAAALLTPVIPNLLALGVAVGLLGLGLALAGGGILALSIGLTAIAVGGAAAASGIVAIVSAILGLIPLIISTLGQVIVGLANAITEGAPAILRSFVAILTSLISAIVTVVPQIIRAATVIIIAFINAIVTLVPKIVDAGLKIVTGILKGIADNIGKIVTQATRVITTFIGALADNIPKVIQAGVDFIIKFIEGLAKAVRDNSEKMGRAGGDLASAIITGMAQGITAGMGEVIKAATGIAGAALEAVKNLLGIASPSREFRKLGEFATKGFAEGLVGTRAEIQQAFVDMKGKLKDAIRSSGDDMKSAEERLKKLTSARKQDNDAIAKARAELAQATVEHQKAGNALDYLTKKMKDSRDKQKGYADDMVAILKDLDNKQKGYDEAVKTRDDYNKSLTDQYSGLGDINGETQLTAYLGGMKTEAENNENFLTAVTQLRNSGLNDKLYQKLLAEGPESMPFVQQLINGGPDALKEINALADRIDTSARTLAQTGSASMYQAGVDIAKGLLQGVKDQKSDLEDTMDDLAERMVKAVKKRLKSKSPSKVMIGIGGDTTAGLRIGLEQTASAVEQAASGVGQSAISGIQKSLSGMNTMGLTIDSSPTIRPVLDLSSVQQGANQIGGMFSDQSLNVDSAYTKATTVSAGYDANQQAIIDSKASVATAGGTVFNQYNNSPKALSEAEIYRNTKNQLSVAKKEV